MDYKGKPQYSYTIVAPAALEAEGDHFFKLHAEWIAKTHPREGDKAMLQYNVAKSKDEAGNIIYVLTEVYETMAGIEEHSKHAQTADFIPDFYKWVDKCQVKVGGPQVIIHSLW